MKKSFLLLLLLVGTAIPLHSSACYNEYFTLDAKGKTHHVQPGGLRFDTNFDLKKIEKELRELGGKLNEKPDFEILSDYALRLVKTGKTKEALVIFEALVKKYPNEYTLHANLGTTYELTGNNQLALEHIQKSILINPKSHKGSEWIHVKLLEAKIAMEKNPNYLNNHSILNLSIKQKASEKTITFLIIQLKERFPFCKGPKDPIMAGLFEDLGDCYMEQISYEYAKAFYQIAVNYYGDKSKRLSDKIEEARTLREQHKNLEPTLDPSMEFDGPEEHMSIIKVGGVPYKEFLYSHKDHTINWEGISLDAKALLALVGIEEKLDKPSAEIKKELPKKTTAKPDKQPASQVGLYLMLGFLGAGFIIFVIYKRIK
ncbi:MAG: hypothetical protein IT221_13105 [Fluviicola sp.]|nr:hypothetical protein [Fluviicola sp.]